MSFALITNNSIGLSISGITGLPGATGFTLPINYGQSSGSLFTNGYFTIDLSVGAPNTKLTLAQYIDNLYIMQNSIVLPGSTSIINAAPLTFNTNGNAIVNLLDTFFAITQQPAGTDQWNALNTTTLRSANNFSYYTVLSSNYNQTDFQYKGDVYVDGTKVVTLTTYPDPATGYGVFDISSIVNKYVSYDYSTSRFNELQNIQEAPNSVCSVQVKFREQYTSGSTFVAPSGTTDTNPVYYLNSSLTFKDSVLTTPETNRYLTTWPQFDPSSFFSFRVKPQSKEARDWLYFVNDALNPVTYIHYVTYDAHGAFIGHYITTNDLSATTQAQIITTGWWPLYQSYNYVSASGTTVDLINDNVASIDVIIGNSPTLYTGSHAFDTFRVTYYDECTKFANSTPDDVYSVYWLNEMGGMSAWRFALKNQTTVTKNQSKYKKIQGSISSDTSGGSYNVNTYDPSNINFYTELTSAIQLNSAFLSDTEVNYLKGLFSSPVVFFENYYNGSSMAATINDSDYVLKRVVQGNPKAYSLQITLNVSASDYRQLQ